VIVSTAAKPQAKADAATLTRRRIFILPTRFGLAYGGLVFAMLLGSLNYGANLGFMLTFLLSGLGIVTMHHCHRNLLGLTLRSSANAPVFAGDPARFQFVLINETDLPRYEICVRSGKNQSRPVDAAPGTHRTMTLAVPSARRGWMVLPRSAVTTRHPGRLFRAWSPVKIGARCLVYPQPAPAGRPLPEHSDSAVATGAQRGPGDDFAGLRTAQPQDPPRRIAWKAYARSDEWLLKEFSGTPQVAIVLDWQMLAELDVEDRLSQLTRWCLDAESGQRSFGLSLPDRFIAPDRGQLHLAECLQALALFGHHESAG
jgi:uncharacterized protein (DUF58 family)